MTKFPYCPILLATAMLAACSASPARMLKAQAQREVEATERAFAQTMARRDHAAFASFLADEAVFFGGNSVMRGKAEVAAGWKPLFNGAAAPFSWEPVQVEVLESGTLALSTGPVRGPEGKVVGVFQSIWRREAPGVWRIVFDKGGDVCDGGKHGGNG